jgi:excisionase family DNA binding protein
MPESVIVISPEQLKHIVREAFREDRQRQAPDALPEVLTREQAGELLQLHPQVVVRYVHEKGLPGAKIGSEWRFRRTALLEWLDNQGQKVA